MAKRNPAIDAYIEKAQPFAKPILKRLRSLIHKACPSVTEDVKWGKPFYLYQDRVLCATMGFKSHCALVFWKASLIAKEGGESAQADLKAARKIKTMRELLPERALLAYFKQAMHLNEPTTKLPPRAERSAPLKVPPALTRALKVNPAAKKHFDAFTPSKKKDYILWLGSAKTEATRTSRLETAIEWISEGKSRNWKYEAAKKKK